jgi:hypothetical protein
MTVEQQLRARVVQLEAQVTALSVENATCAARLTLAGREQADTASRATASALEKEIGCVLDWAVNPPKCKPDEPKLKKP